MNPRDVEAHWVALHEALGVGVPIADEAQYEGVLDFVDQVHDHVAQDPARPGLIDLLADRIRAYEDRVHPWPDTSTPASVLASLMQEHGLTQSDLAEVLDEVEGEGVVVVDHQQHVRSILLISLGVLLVTHVSYPL